MFTVDTTDDRSKQVTALKILTASLTKGAR